MMIVMRAAPRTERNGLLGVLRQLLAAGEEGERGEARLRGLDGVHVTSETDEVPDVVVYTLAWNGDHPAEEGEKPNAQIRSRIVLNGEEVKFVTGITVDASGSDFLTAKIHLCPGSIRFVALTEDEFKQAELPL